LNPGCLQNVVTDFLEKLSDEELKKESKTEAKNDALSAIVKGLKSLGKSPCANNSAW